jgi:hypothetical protein
MAKLPDEYWLAAFEKAGPQVLFPPSVVRYEGIALLKMMKLMGRI